MRSTECRVWRRSQIPSSESTHSTSRRTPPQKLAGISQSVTRKPVTQRANAVYRPKRIFIVSLPFCDPPDWDLGPGKPAPRFVRALRFLEERFASWLIKPMRVQSARANQHLHIYCLAKWRLAQTAGCS
ncbi:hypothetical protein CHELA17_65555 [Chelatococcus asaccharovorans]|nr:hypothetical protein CHELA17_65555 [Chelatococcus asaccharovorans]